MITAPTEAPAAGETAIPALEAMIHDVERHLTWYVIAGRRRAQSQAQAALATLREKLEAMRAT